MDRTPYEVTSLEQMKALSHMLRVKVLNLFSDETPRTAKQMADELGIPKSKVHYHVKELHRVGLLKLVETKEKGGVIEKYYLPIATNLRIRPPEGSAGDPEHRAVSQQVGLAMVDDFVEAYRKSTAYAERVLQEEGKKMAPPSSTVGLIYLTEEQRKRCQQEIVELLMRWEEQYGLPNEEGTSESWQVFTTLFKKPE